MVHTWKIIALAVFFAILAVPAIGGEEEKENACSEAAVTNLLIAVSSDNAGLRESAAYMLGELKCTRAVIPLMKMLHDGEQESERLAAALALSRIGEARGVYAVRQAARFDESAKVRKVAAWFYNEYYQPGTFAFVPMEEPGSQNLADQK